MRNAVEVKAEIAARVKKADVSAGVTRTKEHTVVNTYSVNSRSYIVIPAGYRFCSFSEVNSVKDHLAATGFKWECKLPTYLQTRSITGVVQICRFAKPSRHARLQILSPFSSGGKSAIAHPVAIICYSLCS